MSSERGALYFPFMKVPENAWSTRALLCWDRVGSIIPTKMLDDEDAMRERVGDRMLQLQRAGLVEFIAPDPRLQHAWELRSALLEHLKADEEFTKQRQRAFQKGELARLHVDKAGNALLTGLIELDLARYEDSAEWAWALVEAEVAAIFMALLACALASQDDVNMDPATDDPSSLAAFEYWSSPTDGPTEKRRIQKAAAKNRARTELLKFTLPTPRDEIQPKELAKFKKKYGKQLMAYRAHVEALSRELAKHADDDEDFREAANDARVDLAPELEEVRARLNERRWEEDPGGSLLKVLTPVGAAATAILGAGVAVTVAAPIAAPLVSSRSLRASRRPAMRWPAHRWHMPRSLRRSSADALFSTIAHLLHSSGGSGAQRLLLMTPSGSARVRTVALLAALPLIIRGESAGI